MKRKNFGAQSWLYPMPVLIVAAYDENGTPNAMNAAWGGIYDTNLVMVCLADEHKTTANIIASKAFTVNIADEAHTRVSDYLGIVSGNDVPDKFAKSGLSYEKSGFVNAPVLTDYPMSVECELLKFNEDGICIGRIINVSASEAVLDAKGNIDPSLLRAISYDPCGHTYRVLGDKVGNAFSDGESFGEN